MRLTFSQSAENFLANLSSWIQRVNWPSGWCERRVFSLIFHQNNKYLHGKTSTKILSHWIFLWWFSRFSCLIFTFFLSHIFIHAEEKENWKFSLILICSKLKMMTWKSYSRDDTADDIVAPLEFKIFIIQCWYTTTWVRLVCMMNEKWEREAEVFFVGCDASSTLAIEDDDVVRSTYMRVEKTCVFFLRRKFKYRKTASYAIQSTRAFRSVKFKVLSTACQQALNLHKKSVYTKLKN